jgi:hypothetical protein
MMNDSDSQERREVHAIARRYRTEGYTVRLPGMGEQAPAFLGDIRPDLIAERDDDRVVVEVKRSDSVRGANDVTDIAERVAREQGWRFELVALPPVTTTTFSPDAAIDVLISRVRGAVDAGLMDVAYVYASACLESLLLQLGLSHGLKVRDAGLKAVARQLAFEGILSSDLTRQIARVGERRDQLMHFASHPAPSSDEIEEALSLANQVLQESHTSAV